MFKSVARVRNNAIRLSKNKQFQSSSTTTVFMKRTMSNTTTATVHGRNSTRMIIGMTAVLTTGIAGYILYKQERSIYAAYTMYKISQLYRSFNDKYKERMNQIMNRRYGTNDQQQQPEQQTLTENERLLLEKDEDEFIELYTRERKVIQQQAADLLLELCRRNKGAYVKAGQYLASLNVMLPREFTDTLSVLQDRAPTHSYEETVQIFMDEMHVHPDDLFSGFEREPVASASIAQVHVAYLKDTNQKVAIKIQHPGLEDIFRTDLQAMKWILFAYKLRNKFSLDWLLPQFEKVLFSELDFINEARNCERLKDMFSDRNDVVVPDIFWDKTTKRVLVMEFMDGCKITDLDQLKAMGISPKQVANILISSFSRQTFEHGFIHSDLHAGNILVRRHPQKKNHVQVVYLDHGCYEELSETTRINYSELWKAMVFRQHDDMKYYTKELGIDPEFYLLFAMFLTAANFFDQSQGKRGILDTRTQKSMTKQEWRQFTKRIREKYFVNGRSNVDDIIEEMVDKNSTNKSLVLLLRANAQVRNLHFNLGSPINRFGVMAHSCLRAVHNEMRCVERTVSPGVTIPVKRMRSKPLLEQLSLQLQLMQLRVTLFLLNTLLWLSQTIMAPSRFI